MQRVAVVVFPGSNCDADTLDAARAAGSDAYYVWHRDTDLQQADAVILPGGFSYGDYLRSGAIARFSPVLRAVSAHARAGGAVLGICNGFQILCEAGLLPGALMRNARLKFLSRPVHVRVEATDTPFTGSYERGEALCRRRSDGGRARGQRSGRAALRHRQSERVDARYRRRMQRRPQRGGDHAASGAPQRAAVRRSGRCPRLPFSGGSQCDAARWRYARC